MSTLCSNLVYDKKVPNYYIIFYIILLNFYFNIFKTFYAWLKFISVFYYNEHPIYYKRIELPITCILKIRD